MGEQIEQVSFDMSGKNAVSTAMQLLEKFEGGQDHMHVHVELSSEPKDEEKSQKTSTASLDEFESGSNVAQETANKSIRPNTSHHRVLKTLDQLDDEAPVPTKRVLEELDMPEGTAYAAMSTLYERGLVTRSDDRNESGSYEYAVSEAGEAQLEEFWDLDLSQ